MNTTQDNITAYDTRHIGGIDISFTVAKDITSIAICIYIDSYVYDYAQYNFTNHNLLIPFNNDINGLLPFTIIASDIDICRFLYMVDIFDDIDYCNDHYSDEVFYTLVGYNDGNLKNLQTNLNGVKELSTNYDLSVVLNDIFYNHFEVIEKAERSELISFESDSNIDDFITNYYNQGINPEWTFLKEFIDYKKIKKIFLEHHDYYYYDNTLIIFWHSK